MREGAEAALQARVQHCAGVVRLLGAYEDAECAYLVLERLKGGDLEQALAAHGPFPEAFAAAVAHGRTTTAEWPATHARISRAARARCRAISLLLRSPLAVRTAIAVAAALPRTAEAVAARVGGVRRRGSGAGPCTGPCAGAGTGAGAREAGA